MATLVTFHAHPDDEAIICGGTMAKAAEEGHRVVLVSATLGEHGEVPEGFLGPGETLAERRAVETLEASRILGVSRVEFLGFVDSGMPGTAQNHAPDSFWRADQEEAAHRLAAILAEERADVLTVYDPNGGYGHPDHIQVHRVGTRAAELAGTPVVYEATANRDHMVALMAQAAEAGLDLPGIDPRELGTPGHLVTTTVDVRPYLELKRRAMAAHASQIAETSFFLALPPDLFTEVWGQEWFVRRGAPLGTRETSLFGDGP
ncbi:MAG TPA: PIG-L family deacetylase [Acidimicrobiales bacterium]|nr:PIG-L family deacetylase [Acidimicrobiales bacterium]